ncbi:transforming acidic coiled-coil-containing protein 3 isoform X2 [Varanus komodoensis]|uniref:transforming acidic coiled-coil-containing protein 3 isoform X2 n=1 Tax=Varanus komodoensis TaxID=61221 RepID=UPI001CF7DDC6|nr:transforming acidic coiled-coil-containing protein 3 isoform X2 [Varanus komodoensis]
MSLKAVNTENVSDDVVSESSGLPLVSPEALKSSILCPSQKENVPPKGIVKPRKVTFQSPMRDPQTHRILSPDRRKKPERPFLLGGSTEVPEDSALPASGAVSQQLVAADTEVAEKGREAEGKVSPGPLDDVPPAESVPDVASSVKSSDGLLSPRKGQGTSSVADFPGGEAFDVLLGAPCMPWTAAENPLSVATATGPSALASWLAGDASKRILGSDKAAKLASESNTQSPSVPHAQGSCPFEDLGCGDIKEKAEENTAGAGKSSAPEVPYSFDCNDPNFNPFEGGSDIQNSLRSVPTTERGNDEADPSVMSQHNPTDEPAVTEAASRKPKELVDQSVAEGRVAPATFDAAPPDSVTLLGDGLPLQFPCGRTEAAATESSQMDVEEEAFRSPTEVFGTDMEVDYLEQFGTSSFKGSVLRKQSLYLKFDPLLSESPRKSGPGAHAATPAALLSLCQNGQSAKIAPLVVKPVEPEEKSEGTDLLGPFTDLPVTEALIYSQRDLDAAIEKVKEQLASEVQELRQEALEWKEKRDKKCVEMRKLCDEFEDVAIRMMEASQKEKEEKQQAVSALNSMEKSFADLYKRFEKQKEAIVGLLKNEEALKKHAEECMARIATEEQRYQALKVHTTEKLAQASEEIGRVRNQAKTELTVLRASLRKEQMRTQSLEQSVALKVKENEELTKICNDLISKVENIGASSYHLEMSSSTE